MKGIRRLALVALIAGATRGTAQDASVADSLFRAGRLVEARDMYRALARSRPAPAVNARLGLLALWENRLSEAQSRLADAVRADSSDRISVGALGEVLYRQARFQQAAPLFARLGRSAFAAKLAAIRSPNQVSIPNEGVRLSFAPNAVLPVVEVKVNGVAAHFLIDTGGGESIIDPGFADRIGARRFGADSGAFAGGRTGVFEHAVVDSIHLGSARVTAVPAQVMSTRAFAPAAAGLPVDGILGTVLLSHFRATLDFGAGTLLLNRRSSSAPSGGVTLPFWLLGDHFITVAADAAGVPTLLVLDTGLAMPGGAFVPAASLLTETGVKPSGPEVSGLGGGGRVSVTPFDFPRLSIGSLNRSSVLSVAGAFPPVLEYRFGPRIGGLVSHGFFAGQRITLDFDAMRVFVEQTTAVSAPPVAGPAPGTAVAPPSAGSVPRDTLVSRARRVVELLRDGEYDKLTPMWSARLREQLPPSRLGATWESLVGSVGKVTEILAAEGEGSSVKIPVQFARVKLGVEVVFDSEGMVNGIRIGG
jgi:hypothetical protein